MSDNYFDALLARLAERTGGKAALAEPPLEPIPTPVSVGAITAVPDRAANAKEFLPLEPSSLADAGLSETETEAIVLKLLLDRNSLSGREIAQHVALPFPVVEELLGRMKVDQYIGYRGAAAMNDYMYLLTPNGRDLARRHYEHCSYCGAAPVTLKAYIAGVDAQSIRREKPTLAGIKAAFQDMLLPEDVINQLAQAIYTGLGLFLYGGPGNGKTSIAERAVRVFGEFLWIPRSIGVDGQVIRLYDPSIHEAAPLDVAGNALDRVKWDRRWVRIRRPTVIAGGELTLERLDVAINTATGTCEAPLQLKANGGVLVIDDFGRQRCSIDSLLNRWIVPLEKRHDYLNLPSGKTIQVPFDELIIFSTNLEPRDLVDDAFLRRIPYKISIFGPNREEFHELFRRVAPKFGFAYRGEVVDQLVDTHYVAPGRPLRGCHPRDLLLQVRTYCQVNEFPLEMRPEFFDVAVRNYFSIV